MVSVLHSLQQIGRASPGSLYVGITLPQLHFLCFTFTMVSFLHSLQQIGRASPGSLYVGTALPHLQTLY